MFPTTEVQTGDTNVQTQRTAVRLTMVTLAEFLTYPYQILLPCQEQQPQ